MGSSRILKLNSVASTELKKSSDDSDELSKLAVFNERVLRKLARTNRKDQKKREKLKRNKNR